MISLEPSVDCVLRLLHSLKAAGALVPRSREDAATLAQAEPFFSLEAAQSAGFAAAAAAAAGRSGGAGKAAVAAEKRVAEAAALLMKQAAALRRAATLAAGGSEAGAGAGGAGVGVAPPTSSTKAAVRAPTVWVFNNAATDSYRPLQLEFVPDNPGASFIPNGADSKREGLFPVAGVPLDDLLPPGPRDPAQPPPPPHLPVLEPSRVRLIKVSAEGYDSRVLHGLRRLLSMGKVPFVVFVYNNAHVKEHGCDPLEFINTLVDHGYRMWHAGIFYARSQDVALFLKGQGNASPPRSTELVFVGPDAVWA